MGRILNSRIRRIDIDDTHKDETAFEESEIRPNPQYITNRRFREPETM